MPSQDAARLQPPDVSTPSGAKTTEPPQNPDSSILPAGIPQFALAKDQVASGLKPILDGVDWLKQKGYRAVLHLRRPDEDDSGDRALFEARGLKYESLAVSPETLATAVQAFNKSVVDAANYPLFVYDRDGVLAGPLWYLHFRTVDKADHTQAMAKASRLGLKEDFAEPRWSMSLAIQKFLESQKN